MNLYIYYMIDTLVLTLIILYFIVTRFDVDAIQTGIPLGALIYMSTEYCCKLLPFEYKLILFMIFVLVIGYKKN